MLNDIASTLAAINQIVSSPEAIELISTLNKTMKTIDGLARNIDNNLQPLADNTTDTLRSINSLAQNLNIALEEIVSAARSIRIFAETIERQPETLLRGKNPQN